jgi:hypothetical protein
VEDQDVEGPNMIMMMMTRVDAEDKSVCWETDASGLNLDLLSRGGDDGVDDAGPAALVVPQRLVRAHQLPQLLQALHNNHHHHHHHRITLTIIAS